MKRCNKILEHKLYIKAMDKIEELEKNRIYCLHDFAHSMDTARIMYIKALEDKTGLDKEIIYAAAILHDMGRFEQYTKNIPHDIASARLAEVILPECGFCGEETALIVKAISEHRSVAQSDLGRLLGFADSKSRMCMKCKAQETCKWSREEMNMEVEY